MSVTLLSEKEISKIALILFSQPTCMQDYVTCVAIVKKAHGQSDDKIDYVEEMEKLKKANKELCDRLDYLLGSSGLVDESKKKIIRENAL